MHTLNPDEQPAKISAPIKPLRLAYGPDPLQFGDLYVPNEPGLYPIVILIHGGYWRARYGLDLMNSLAEDLAKRGYAAWNIEYRRVGNPGGGWPGTFLDVALATDFLRKLAPSYKLDLQRVVPIGHSAGGHLALWLAARPRIPLFVHNSPLAGSQQPGDNEENATPLMLAGAISLAGVIDLEMAWRLHLSNGAVVELLGGSFTDVPERYVAASPAAMLPLGVPLVLIHGTNDDSVPLQVSQAYTNAARAVNDPVTYIELEGVDHFDVIDPHSNAWTITLNELQKLERTN
ncbi:MAG TPA: alpha/beta hydrolase [Ktedonobacteraceae bacterium]